MTRSTPSVEETMQRAHRAIAAMQQRISELEVGAKDSTEPIAVVGMGCRFPGADDASEYWDLLANGRDAVGEVPADRWSVDEFSSDGVVPGFMATRQGGFLSRVDTFDHEFFGISRREAVLLDPQQRLLLEVTWQALEHAGIDPGTLAGTATGVFVGISSFDFPTEYVRTPDDYTAHASTGMAHSVAAGRIAYTLDLRGPCLSVDTACSSALVAIHQAVASLRRGEADTAIAAGVNVILSPLPSISFSQFERMVSPEGRCRAFDVAADGYVRSEGCGTVILKRLSDAVAAGDRILATVRGSAINQDGRSAGLTAPNGSAQRDVLRAAVDASGVDPLRVGLIEAHGTGTHLGDPIEAEAVAAVYGRESGDPLHLGSGKTNIGHAEAAAGIAAFIKTVLALHHRQIPENVNFTALNPAIDLDGTNIAIPTALTAWPRPSTGPRAAGVSSFGFSGTNAHAVLEEAPDVASPAADTDAPGLLVVSARDARALRELANRYADVLDESPTQTPALLRGAATRRAHLTHRVAVTGSTAEELADALRRSASGTSPALDGIGLDGVVFLYSGQGGQHEGMARRLYDTNAVFRGAVDECAAILDDLLDRSIIDLMYPTQRGVDPSPLQETRYAQPALFAVEYGLTRLWMSWGVRPAAVMGHSLGEYVAAAVVGVMTLKDALLLTVTRARLLGTLASTGAMATVFTPELDVARQITDHSRVAIGAVNGPANVTVSGAAEEVSRIVDHFDANGDRAHLLHISTASHSPLVDPILAELRAVAETITYSAPRIPLVSNVTGQCWDWTSAPDADYWVRHARQPVRFAAGTRSARAAGYRRFLEVGPHSTLAGLLTDALGPDTDAVVVPSLRIKHDDWAALASAAARLYVSGTDIDFTRMFPGPASPDGLPLYPFADTRCWPSSDLPTRDRSRAAAVAGVESTSFHRIDWVRADLQTTDAANVVAVLATDDTLAAALAHAGVRTRTLPPGTSADEIADVSTIIFAPAARPAGAEDLVGHATARAADYARAAGLARSIDARLWLVTAGAAGPDPRSDGSVPDAVLWGMARSLATELPATWGGAIDLDPTDELATQAPIVADLIGQAADSGREDQIAIRAGTPLAARLRQEEDAARTAAPSLRPDAAYLVSGGHTGVGLELARTLADRGARRLVLVGRTPLPDRESWGSLHTDDPAAGRVAAVVDLEARGVAVESESLDVANQVALTEFLARRTRRALPPVRGAVHAAGFGSAQSFTDLDESALDRHLRPKLGGAIAMHHALPRLDFLAVCSSIAGVLTSPQAAAYAGANAGLDAFADAIRATGTDVVSIGWPVWSDVGMAAEGGATDSLTADIGVLTPTEGAATFGAALARSGAVTVLPSGWQEWGARLYRATGIPLLRGLFDGVDTDPDHPDRVRADDLLPDREALAAMPAPGTEAALRTGLAAIVGSVLGASGAVELGRPLLDLGLDSLMAIEVRNRIESRLRVTVPLSAFLNGTSTAGLASIVAADLDATPGHGADGPALVVDALDDAELAAAAAELTDSELAELLDLREAR